MGYRSDVLIAVAFHSPQQREEVWAVYCMDPRVQRCNLAAQWKTYDEREFPTLVYEDEDVKWYDSYDDVSGIEHMLTLVDQFAKERGFKYAACKLRIGEDTGDVEERNTSNDSSGETQSFIWEMCGIERRIVSKF